MQSPPPPLPLFPIDTAQTAPLAERKSGNASPLQPYSVPLPPSPASPSLPTTLSADATNAMRAQGLPSPTPRPFLLTPSRPTAPQPASHLALPAPSNTQTKPSGKRNQSLQTPTPIRTGPSSLFSLQQPQQYLHQPYPQPANIHPHLSAHHHQHHQQHALLPSGVVAQGPVTAQLQNGLPLHYAHAAASLPSPTASCRGLCEDEVLDSPLSAPPLSHPAYSFNLADEPAWRLAQQLHPQPIAGCTDGLPPLPVQSAELAAGSPIVNSNSTQIDASAGRSPCPVPPNPSTPPSSPCWPLNYQLPIAFVERYKLGECLGSGGFGFVCSAFSKLNEEVAVKFILKEKVPNGSWTRDETLGIVPKEIYLLKHLNHPNIIRFLDAFEDHLYFLLVTELHGGSWSQLRPNSPEDSSSPQALRRRPSSDLFECIELLKSLSEPQARHVFQQLLDVVAHLETFGILHRDIKDENILIDDNFNVKLIDFGSASFANQVSDRLFLGTLQYAAPEILEGRQHQGAKCEVWSLACCLYIMLVGEAPFETPRDVRSSKPTALRERSPSLSQPCKELLTWMFEKDPWRRPTITQILNHPWVLDARSA